MLEHSHETQNIQIKKNKYYAKKIKNKKQSEIIIPNIS